MYFCNQNVIIIVFQNMKLYSEYFTDIFWYEIRRFQG